MKKQQNYDDAANALNFVDNLESIISTMERDAEQIWQQYYVCHVTSEFFTVAMANCPERQEQDRQYYLASAQERILSDLRYYLSLPCDKVRTREDAERLAYRIQLQKAAQRLCARYDIELN